MANSNINRGMLEAKDNWNNKVSKSVSRSSKQTESAGRFQWIKYDIGTWKLIYFNLNPGLFLNFAFIFKSLIHIVQRMHIKIENILLRFSLINLTNEMKHKAIAWHIARFSVDTAGVSMTITTVSGSRCMSIWCW